MDIILKSAALGLSTGIFCFGYCLPALFPLYFGEDSGPLKSRVLMFSKFSAGRLAAYILFGGLIGSLGQNINAVISQQIAAVSIIVLSILLLFYGISKTFGGQSFCAAGTNLLRDKSSPFIFGFFSGLNICPPFLIAVSYVFNLGRVLDGMWFFFIFFCATSIYLVPFIFLGRFSKQKEIRRIAQLSALLSGFIFFWSGISQLV